MDQPPPVQNRQQRRANVLMAAMIELSGQSLPVKLRNLSSDGALVEGEHLPIEGAEIVFKRKELSLAGRVVWTKNGRAGLSFYETLSPEAVLRHVPTPQPRMVQEFRRPGLTSRPLTPDERRAAAVLLTPGGVR